MISSALADFSQKEPSVARNKKRQTLADWIEGEMRRRHIGVNEFARLCGVSSGTISKHISKRPPNPTTAFLRKLSQGAGVPLLTLLNIVYPELEKETEVDAEALAIARSLMQLPNQTRDMFVRIMETMKDAGHHD
jgi:transcriptional regulator with XRE-family HTH domain